ncbi:MAG TPA: tetratricopeptide repeat protein [Trebonia sp.]|nr:tetratricopeptide repeat protein [Trebonia sp.]
MQQPRDFSLYGAVDLGARQAATQRRQQAARAASSASAQGGSSGDDDGAGDAAGYVIDVTEQTFNEDVAMRSQSVPVIVDLWAEWCGPCKQLSPVLEKLAAEANGAWVLARIDVDANPRLAQAFQAQSIPMVVAIIGGQMVDAFLGAMPEAQVRQWLAQILSVAEQLGLPPAGDAAPVPDAAAGTDSDDDDDDLPPHLRAARDAIEAGELDSAASLLEKALSEVPSDGFARSMLAQVNVMRRVSGYDDVTAIARQAAERPDDPDAQAKLADLEVASGRSEEAFDRLLGVIKRTTGDDRNKARVHLIDLFEIFPPGDPAVKAARQRLSSLLF